MRHPILRSATVLSLCCATSLANAQVVNYRNITPPQPIANQAPAYKAEVTPAVATPSTGEAADATSTMQNMDEPSPASTKQKEMPDDLSELGKADTDVMETEFTDALFKDALRATYSNNPRIIAQRKFFEQTAEQFNQAFSGWLPSFTGSYSRGRARNRSGDTEWNYLDSEDKRLNLSQPIFNGGETIYATSQSEHLINASGADLISTTQDVLLDGISSYLDVVRDRQTLDLSKNNESVLEQQLDASQERFDVGEATRTDVSQSSARLSRAQADTIQARGNLATSEARFERLVGMPPAAVLGYPEYVPDIPAKLEDAINIAMEYNPRILSAIAGEKAADDAVGVNKAGLLPDVSLDASMSRAKGAFTGIDFDSDQVLVNVSVPFYQAGAQYSRVRESKKEKSRRLYELLETKNEVRQLTIEAWEDYQTAVAAIDAQRNVIEAAEIALDGVKQEQLYGSRTVLDVLDAEQELFVARVNLVRSQRNRMVAIYNILSVLGALSPENLALEVDEYDQNNVAGDIKYQLIGF